MLWQDGKHIFALAFADIRFEWILSLCMVLALGAIFAPLFILLGLQQGIVGNMLDELKYDPVSRLVTPRFPTRTALDTVWLESLKQNADVVIQSPTSHLLLNVKGIDQQINTLPTKAQDPLMLENNIDLTTQGKMVVLSSRLAKKIGKQKGDSIELVLVRNINGKERVIKRFDIAGVLPQAASMDLKIWLPQELFNGIYQWRKGKAFSSLGLVGKGGYLLPEYEGIIALSEKLPTDEEYHQILAGRSSFSQLPKALDKLGWITEKKENIRLWQPLSRKIYLSDFPNLVNRYHELGYAVEMIPFVEKFPVELLLEGQNKPLSLTILPNKLQPEIPKSNVLYQPLYAWVSPKDIVEIEEKSLVSTSISFASILNEKSKILLPVVLIASENVASGHIALPAKIAGKMNAARKQMAKYDETVQEFYSVGTTNYYFRAYAKSIDDIEPLIKFVRQHGIERGENALREPISKLAEVYNVQKLSGYMGKLYLLIVSITGFSAFFAIVANVYAGVERKRRDLAYLQLLGIDRSALFIFPYIKSQILVIGGLVIAFVTYLLFGTFADIFFADVLEGGESLTRLSLLYVAILMVTIFLASSLASLLAATTVSRIEAGEIIHA